jgi:hypothetical protein
MAKKKKKKLRTGRLVLFIVLILLIVALVGAVLFLVLNRGSGSGGEDSTEATTVASRELTYEGGVVTSGNGFQQAVDEMYSRAAEGYAALEYENDITSEDGLNFKCYIANSLSNRYDMFVAIYLDDDLTDELYLSGLIPTGSAMEKFTAEHKVEPGSYSATLVMTQVESDNATMHAQVMHAVTVTVK